MIFKNTITLGEAQNQVDTKGVSNSIQYGYIENEVSVYFKPNPVVNFRILERAFHIMKEDIAYFKEFFTNKIKE